MNNYLLTIILVSICIGIIEIISPDNNGLSKYTQTIGLLIILFVIISPISKILNTIDDNFINQIKDNILADEEDAKNKYEELMHEYLNNHSVKELENQIKDILDSKFEVANNDCEIKIIAGYVEDKYYLNEIKIILSGKSIFKNPYSIEEYFSELLKCKCTVVIK